jgi:predicted nucleic-acid-binding Zn-ribbon protein
MELITIRTFNNYFSANILLTKLRDAGIQCYLKDEHTVTIDPLLANAVGGIKLVINKKDSHEVFQLLEQFDTDFRRKAVCPKCGSHNIELVPKHTTANMIAAILSWLFSSYAVSAENVYQCITCGYESNTLPEAVQTGVDIFESESLN